jgi:hypothetical protein
LLAFFFLREKKGEGEVNLGREVEILVNLKKE